jgi:hypothetical protein
MAQRRPRQGGRQSKGPRDLLATRLPMDEADWLRDLADEIGMTNSDTIAVLLRIARKHLDELPSGVGEQKELPLHRAS